MIVGRRTVRYPTGYLVARSEPGTGCTAYREHQYALGYERRQAMRIEDDVVGSVVNRLRRAEGQIVA